jgi:ketosteroid isomerase-like protein
MRRIWIVAMFLLVVSMGAFAADCDKAIEGVRDSWLTAWKAKQLDEVMKLYAEDATLLSRDGHLHVGRTQIRAYFKTSIDSVTAVLVQPTGVVCSSFTGYDTGTYSQTISKPGGGMGGKAGMGGGGGTSTEQGNYAVTLRQESGKWQIVQHANVHSEWP